MEKSFGAMLRQLPNQTEVPNLLVDISQTGLAAGLEEKLFQPQNEARKDFYAELPISIRLTGGYHQMGNFASGIAALPRIVTLHNIEITPAGGNNLTKGDLVLNVTAKTYRYVDEEDQVVAGEGKGKKGASGKGGGK
jgi:type IV pilus assembly protein PilO